MGEDATVRLPRGDNVVLQFFRTQQRLRVLMTDVVVAGSGITGEEYAVLSVTRALGRPTPKELAARISMPPTSLSRHIASLAEADLITRSPNPDDGRSYVLEVNARGQAVLQAVAPRMRRLVEDLAHASHVPLAEITAALVELEHAALAVIERRSHSGR